MIVSEIKSMNIEDLIKVLEEYPKDRQVKVYYDANETDAIQIDVLAKTAGGMDKTYIDNDGFIHFR